MSPATADRILKPYRKHEGHGISTTRSGTLLKKQIPIRTFNDWNESKPGFMEADLVAHCGTNTEGSFLHTLTLTDIATGWTECLPLLNRGQEAVVAALKRAQLLLPFPLLGIDTDNGAEFINMELLAFCEQEHIAFTRGRPRRSNDQCYVEQKNGQIVRQVVGYDRFVGEFAYRQLTELYRALRVYVNCFQPSMKLQTKEREGSKVRRTYDQAQTPMQRLLASGVLPVAKQQELLRIAQVLDPMRLLTQLEHATRRPSGGTQLHQRKRRLHLLLRFSFQCKPSQKRRFQLMAFLIRLHPCSEKSARKRIKRLDGLMIGARARTHSRANGNRSRLGCLPTQPSRAPRSFIG